MRGAGVFSDIFGSLGLGRRRRVVRKRKVGRGAFGDLFKKAKNAAIDAAKRIHKNIKDTKSISRALGYSKHAGKSSTLGDLANSLGYGRRRVVRRRKVGRGAFGDLFKKAKNAAIDAAKRIHKNIKDTKSVSRALGYSKHANKSTTLGNLANSLGYGRRRVVRRRKVGRGFLGDVFGGIKKGVSFLAKPVHDIVKKTGVIGKLAPGPLGTVAKLAGYGRRRTVRRRKVGRGLFSTGLFSGLTSPSLLQNLTKKYDVIGKLTPYLNTEKAGPILTAARALGFGRRKRGGATMMVNRRLVGGRLNQLAYGQVGGRLNQFAW